MRAGAAVLTSGGRLVYSPRGVSFSQRQGCPATVAALPLFGQPWRQLWVDEGGLEWLGLPTAPPARHRRHEGVPHPFMGGELGTPALSVRPGGLSAWTTVASDADWAELVLPSWDRAGPFYGLRGAALAQALAEYSHALEGAEYRVSPAVTSDGILRRQYRTRGRLAMPCATGLAGWGPRAFDGQVFDWANPDPPAEHITAHRFDVNAMFLGGASSLPLPTGDPVDATGAVGAVSYSFPGLWAYDRPVPAEVDAVPLLPAPLEPGTQVTTPTARLIFDVMGWRPAEGLYWPEHHRYLEAWYKVMREARAYARAPGRQDRVRGAVKATYTAGIGRLGSALRSDARDPLYLPYWHHAVIAEARARLARRLLKVPLALRRDLVSVRTDTVTVRAEGTPLEVAEAFGLPISTQVGHFHYLGAGAP